MGLALDQASFLQRGDGGAHGLRLHAFRARHRIMIQVQSSWYPFIDRNPQTFVDVFHAVESDFRPATHRIFRSGDKPSGLRVLVVRGRLPR